MKYCSSVVIGYIDAYLYHMSMVLNLVRHLAWCGWCGSGSSNGEIPCLHTFVFHDM